jgi:general secretion pathway protein E
VGPTGSGKTTTVTTVLALDPHAKNKRRISLEIPPESDVPWLSQIPTSEELLADHADGVVRSDPDVISGGEVRNRMTATMAQDYALTGHLTWVTFHGNGVFPAFVRLLSDRIQFDRDILTMDRFLRAAFFQYLIGVLCTHCRKPAHGHLDDQEADVLRDKFGLNVDTLYVRHHSTGDNAPCPHCRGTGITDRTLAAEIVVPTRTMLRSIAKGDIAAADLEYRQRRNARFDEPGTLGKTYVEHALYKVSQGIACAAALFEMENLYTYEVEPRPCDQPKALRLVGDGV